MKFNTSFNSLVQETRIYFYKSRGPGGQKKNKRETSVRLHHIPSGIWIIATEARSQARNRELAFRRLKERLTQLNKRKKPRIPTNVPLAIKEEILRKKRLRAEKKRLRRKVNISDY
jgi:protein subunit release factor A